MLDYVALLTSRSDASGRPIYLSVFGGSGAQPDVLNPDSFQAGAWETFLLLSLTSFSDGQLVMLVSDAGRGNYLSAVTQGPGSGTVACQIPAASPAGPQERFQIFNLTRPGSSIASGDTVCFVARNRPGQLPPRMFLALDGGGRLIAGPRLTPSWAFPVLASVPLAAQFRLFFSPLLRGGDALSGAAALSLVGVTAGVGVFGGAPVAARKVATGTALFVSSRLPGPGGVRLTLTSSASTSGVFSHKLTSPPFTQRGSLPDEFDVPQGTPAVPFTIETTAPLISRCHSLLVRASLKTGVPPEASEITLLQPRDHPNIGFSVSTANVLSGSVFKVEVVAKRDFVAPVTVDRVRIDFDGGAFLDPQPQQENEQLIQVGPRIARLQNGAWQISSGASLGAWRVKAPDISAPPKSVGTRPPERRCVTLIATLLKPNPTDLSAVESVAVSPPP